MRGDREDPFSRSHLPEGSRDRRARSRLRTGCGDRSSAAGRAGARSGGKTPSPRSTAICARSCDTHSGTSAIGHLPGNPRRATRRSGLRMARAHPRAPHPATSSQRQHRRPDAQADRAPGSCSAPRSASRSPTSTGRTTCSSSAPNPLVSNGSLATSPDVRQRLRDIRERGGKVIVIDPRRTRTAAGPDEHHFIRPGTDAFLLLGIDPHRSSRSWPRAPRSLDDHTRGVPRRSRSSRARFAGARSPRRVGIEAEEIRRLTRELATRSPRAAVYGADRHLHAGVRHARRAGSSTCVRTSLDRPSRPRRAARCSRAAAAGAANTRGEPGRGRGRPFAPLEEPRPRAARGATASSRRLPRGGDRDAGRRARSARSITRRRQSGR